MGIYDRDWYKEAYKEKEAKYGKDFSNKSSHFEPKSENAKRGDKNASNNQEFYSQNIHQPTNTVTMSFGDDPNDSSKVIGLGVCPKCLNYFRVRTPKRALYEYNYTCPACQQKIFVRSDKPRSKGAKIARGLFYGIGIPCVIIVAFVMISYFFSTISPEYKSWFSHLVMSTAFFFIK